jgi:hypothetical protein
MPEVSDIHWCHLIYCIPVRAVIVKTQVKNMNKLNFKKNLMTLDLNVCQCSALSGLLPDMSKIWIVIF